ncbi:MULTISPECIES: MetS family NSS transporter small subunit [Microbacterium]|uniref:Methionine and alanine importer, small subunit n=1 Tax=Microbacterium barkeri TaxID=33917 RepID=A0A9W6LX12_9MICO|nr:MULTISPECIES: MetS family NSS transporter small subunit [Microbacterium]MDR6876367.1 hypothetical protein [Microbacterium barkeri]WRH17152.1 MetS family NSS transporter small subunit [Microbacterium sp. JZ37]GLJ61992.1 hypothetical protein GCM10017576_21220 [Microbacterium barkeri]
MTAIATLFFIIAAVLIWGGLVASIVFLSSKPEVPAYPDGAVDDEGDD